jgi:hypothetical protein
MIEHERFEQELRALQPREPSAELTRRIASRLAATPAHPAKEQPPFWRGSALVGGLLAASVAAIIAWQGGRPSTEEAPSASLDVDVANVFDESLPSLWTYRRTLSREAQSVNRLLDRHASGGRDSAPPAAAFIVARSGFDVDRMTGEL